MNVVLGIICAVLITLSTAVIIYGLFVKDDNPEKGAKCQFIGTCLAALVALIVAVGNV